MKNVFAIVVQQDSAGTVNVKTVWPDEVLPDAPTPNMERTFNGDDAGETWEWITRTAIPSVARDIADIINL